jgi:DNA-binding transcriptional ArsR family regulator
MPDVGDQPTRRRILEFVNHHAGASARDIQRALSLGWGETAYHLDQLLRGSALQRDRAGWRDYYFPPEFPPRDRKLLMALQSPAERVLLVELALRPEQTLAQLGERVPLSSSTLGFHLRVLLAQDLVRFAFGEGVRRYRADRPEMVLRLYRSYRDSWGDRWTDRFSETFGGLVRD